MGAYEGPNIVTASMSFYVDAANTKSYTEIANGWKDLTGNVQTPLSMTGTKFVPVNEGIVNFDGNQGSSASNGESFFSTSSRTFDVWVRREQDVSTYNMVWGLWLPYLAMMNTEKFLFSYNMNQGSGNNQATHNSIQSFVDNRWYHVTCTVEYNIGVSTVSNMYIDGELDSTITTANVLTTTITPTDVPAAHNLILGNWHPSNTNTRFNGSISNFKIYERVLSAEEVRRNYQAHVTRFLQDIPWKDMIFFVDAGRSRSFTKIENGWTDLTQNQSTLPISGAYYDSSGGGSIAFNGIAGSASTSVAFVQYAEMTFDVWFNRTSSVSLNCIWSIGNTLLQFEGTGQFRFTWVTRLGAASTGAGREVLSPLFTYVDGVWYNVTTTLVQNLVTGLSTAKMYVNGELVATNTPTSPLLDQVWQSTSGIKIGLLGVNAFRPFNGKVSNFKIFRRVLTDAEVLKNYLAMKDRFGHP